MSRQSRSSCNSRGFTLVEALVTTALLAMVLAAVGVLSSRYLSLMRFDAGKERTLSAMQVALDRIRSECREGVQLLQPASSAVVGTIELNRIDAGAGSVRTPWPIPSPLASWDPADPVDLTLVRFEVAGNNLVREATQSSGASETQVLSERVTGLQARLLPDDNLEVTLRIEEEGRFRDLTTEVFLPLR